MGSQQMMMGMAGETGVPVPAGAILPYSSSSAPSGWSLFTSANGRYIVGAGSSYAAGATGGETTKAISATASNTGTHPGQPRPGGTCGPGPNDQNPGGAHSHNISVTASCEDVYKDFVLIKADAETLIPAGAMLLGASSLAELTNVETTTDRFLRANSTYGGTGGSSSLSGPGTSSNSGSHNHGSAAGNCSPEGEYPGNGAGPSGSHSHAFTVTGTLATKRRYLTAWTNAAEEFGAALNGICMYESGTPPAGWSICNGTNGTPDMRDYFCRIGNTGNQGTSAGDNNVSWSASLSNDVPHGHISGGGRSNQQQDAGHNGKSWSHTHNVSGSVTVTQSYYALYFIMYTG